MPPQLRGQRHPGEAPRHRRGRVPAAIALLAALLLALATPLGSPAGAATTTPVITVLAPFAGSTLGGQGMTIYGSGFTGATGVRFGPHAMATDVVVVSDTQINCTIPPAPTPSASGPVNVFVHAPGVVSATSAATVFWYQAPPPPTVTTVSPASGPTTGGTELTITGTGLGDPWEVRVDGIVATDMTPISPTQLRVRTPAHATGPVGVTVQTVGGTSAPGSFTYVDPRPPNIARVTPGALSAAGGTVVTIEGSGFNDATKVRFGLWGAPVPFTLLGDNHIEVVAPPGPGGTIAGIRVTTPLGTSDPWRAWYVTAPEIDGIAPIGGPTAGGTVVQIVGLGFSSASGVSFGGVPALTVTHFGVGQDGRALLLATAPPLPPGPVDVVVHGVSGDSVPDAASTFVATDATPPSIGLITPRSIPSAGGTPITVSGSGFATTTAVHVGIEPAVAVQIVSDTELVVTPPPRTAGTLVTVFVTTATGATSVRGPTATIVYAP